ncbi:24118_t:CDS:2 [Gigaspora rosea]|nr:24118_t:CDS:2 [Gigaspora rosea]
MPRKNAKISKLERLLRSQDSTPGQIWDAFTDYTKSTKEFHKRRRARDEISEKEYKETIHTLNNLEIKVKGLINQNFRLENRNQFLETEIKRLLSENENLQIEKEQYKAAIIHSNEISGFQNFSVEANKICYANFDDALRHSEQRIHEIDDTGNNIDAGPSLSRSYSFYDPLTSGDFDSEMNNQESTSDSNMVVEESSVNNL